MEHSVSVIQFAQARASEIATLMGEVSAENTKRKSWFQNLPHHMRRRNASHNPKRVPKNLRVQNKSNAVTKPSKGKKHKKLPKDLKVEYASRSKLGSTWLENHIWYAKRFKMKNLWGYQLPFNSNDRKLGSSHNAAANRCMLQDLSYYCCIELAGVQDDLLKILSVVTDSSSGHTFASELFLDGSKEGHTFLYHPNSFPYRAIGPVSFIWRPVFDAKTSKYKTEISGDIMRRLWIWCHPSIHDELVQVLSSIFNFEETKTETDEIGKKFTFACQLNYVKNQQHFCKEKIYSRDDIRMVLRKNTLVRHRLTGPMSLSILTKVLKLADVGDSVVVKKENDSKRFKGEETELWWQSYFKDNLQKDLHSVKGDLLGLLADPQSMYYVSPSCVIGLTVRDPRIEASSKQQSEGNHSEGTPTDPSNIDSLLTPETSDSALWLDDIRNKVTATKLSDQEINKERSNTVGPIELGKRENRIPVIIIHQTGLNGFGSGWDFIAPLGWSLEFWRSFHRKGCTTAGLRDLHFVNLEAGQPSFPCSFPDTAAGKNYEEQVRLEALKEYHRRPKSKRPNFDILGVSTPFYMCWKTLVKDWEKLLEDTEKFRNLFPSIEQLVTKKNEETGCEREYYVLRQMELRKLASICGKLNKIPKREVSDQLVDKLSKDLDGFVLSTDPGTELGKSLISVKVNCSNKGVPSQHSRVYLLSAEDLKEIQINPHYNGHTEPPHEKPNEKKEKSFDRPQLETLVSGSSRKLIGYISEGGYSSVCGRGYGIGHCSSIGFLIVLKQCLEARLRPLVLFKEQHCVKYRVANVEIIDNY